MANPEYTMVPPSDNATPNSETSPMFVVERAVLIAFILFPPAIIFFFTITNPEQSIFIFHTTTLILTLVALSTALRVRKIRTEFMEDLEMLREQSRQLNDSSWIPHSLELTSTAFFDKIFFLALLVFLSMTVSLFIISEPDVQLAVIFLLAAMLTLLFAIMNVALIRKIRAFRLHELGTPSDPFSFVTSEELHSNPDDIEAGGSQTNGRSEDDPLGSMEEDNEGNADIPESATGSLSLRSTLSQTAEGLRAFASRLVQPGIPASSSQQNPATGEEACLLRNSRDVVVDLRYTPDVPVSRHYDSITVDRND